MELKRISSLKINGLGAFDKLDITFKEKVDPNKAEIHIFTGENGTGKTTLLQALTYFDYRFNEMYYKTKSLDNPYEYDLIRNKYRYSPYKPEPAPPISICFNDRNYYHFSILSGFKFDVDADDYIRNYYKIFVTNGHNKGSNATYFFAYSGNRQMIYPGIKVFKEIDYNPLSDALDFNRAITNSNIFQWIANIKTRSALAFHRGDKDASNQLIKSMELIENSLSEITGRKIEFILDEEKLQVLVKVDNAEVSFNQLADGYKSVISWFVDLISRLDKLGFPLGDPTIPSNFILFLDEIEVHLHPSAQRRILPVIQKLFPTAQIFLTTHSPFVIGSVDGAWVYKFKLDDKGNSVLDGEPALSNEGMSYGYIFEDTFGIKEDFGPDVKKKLDAFYDERKVLIKNPDSDPKELLRLSKELADRGEELRSIIGSELKQLSRVTKRELSL